jgi:hypothetical protein
MMHVFVVYIRLMFWFMNEFDSEQHSNITKAVTC